MPSLHSFLVEQLKNKLKKEEKARLPHSCARVGHVAILDLDPSLQPYSEEIGNKILSFFPKQRTVAIKIGPAYSDKRIPELKVIAGDLITETIHKELNCAFKLDPLKITFSSGNHYERKRLIKLIDSRETIVDMFACVGNLSLPVCVHKSVNCFGIEINPVAFKYLSENIQLNKVSDRYTAIYGDNREVTPQNIANRVILGYFGVKQEQVVVALKALRKNEGGWVIFHDLCERKRPSQAIMMIQTALNALDDVFQIKEVHSRRVKWVSGAYVHYVHDVYLNPY